MRTPSPRPWPRRHPWLVALFLVLPSLGVWFGVGAGPDGPDGKSAWWRPDVAQANDAPGRARYERAGELIDEGLYREALDLLGTGAIAGVGQRELRLRRATAGLRWTGLPEVDRARDPQLAQTSERELVDLLETDDDDVAAFAFAELARAGARPDVLVQQLEKVLGHWERSTDLERAGAHYADLLRALLQRQMSLPHQSETTLLRMWENLVAAEADATSLREIAALVLTNSTERPVGRGGWNIVADWRHQTLGPRVARDVLTMDAPPWLRVEAHAELGFDAHRKERFTEAVAQFRAALALLSADDSRAARQVSELLASIVSPAVSMDGARLYRPGSEHRVELNWRNLREWELRVRRVDPRRELRLPSQYQAVDDLAQYFAEGAGTVVVRRARTDEVEQRARTQDAPSAERHAPRRASVRLDALEPGVYVFEFVGTPFEGEARPAPARTVVVVTQLGVVQQNRLDALSGDPVTDYWAVTMQEGRPLEGLELLVHRAQGTSGSQRIEWSNESTRTGSDGRAVLARRGDPSRVELVVGSHQGHPIFFPARNWYAWDADQGAQLRGLVWSDRPLYRPGEAVQLQAFVRELKARERKVTLPTANAMQLVIHGPDGEVFLEREVRLDANGSVDLSVDIPASAALGHYAVVLKESTQNHAASGSFQVDEYRLPEFTVTVELDTEQRYVLGDTLQVDLSAAYLFGGPVQGTAEVVVRRERVWSIWMPHPWLPWSEDVAPKSNRMGRIMPPPYGNGGEEVLRTNLALDEAGRARIAIATERRDSEPGDFRYVVQALVTDATRREERGMGTVTVGERELVAFLRSARHVVAPGDRAEVTLRVQDVMGRGVAHEGTWELSVSDEKGRRRSLRTETVQTDADGRAILQFSPEREGHYTVTYRTVDGRGMDVTANTVVWVADPRTRNLPFAERALDLIVERDEFLGDTAHVLLVSDTPGAPVLLTRTHAGGSEVTLIRMKGTAQLLEIPLDVLHRPGFSLHAMRVRDWRVHEAQVRVVAPEAERLLQLDLEFAESEVEPGATVPLRVRATDAHGVPVSTVLSLAVVDQAILQLKPRALADPVEVFHRFPTAREPHRVSMAASLGAYVELEEEEEGANEVEGYGLYDADEEVRMGAAKSGRSEDFISPPPAASGLVASQSLMRAVAAPSESAAPEAFVPTAVRTDFRTTALWRVNVRTDSDGRATIDVPLAQSLTTWNATVLALDPQTRTGRGEVEVRTRKPVMVRLNHPRVFRERDGFTIAAVVHNDRAEDLEAVVQLVTEDLEIAPRTQSVTVPAYGDARVQWTVEVPGDRLRPVMVRDDQGRIVRTEPASVKLQVAVRTEQGDDAFERTVPLLAFGTGAHVAAIIEQQPGRGELSITLPGDRVPGTETLTLTVAPSLLSTAMEALPYLAQYPYGCTEQTLSRFVPAVAVRTAAQRLGARAARIDPELDAKITQGLERIASMQNDDGSWSWWKDGEGDPYITAHALVALARARRDGVNVQHRMLERGRDALRSMMPRIERRDDDLAYALLALVEADRSLHQDGRARTDEAMLRWAGQLFDRRDRLRAYARALTARVLFAYGDADRAQRLLRHLGNDVQQDQVLSTAHWGRTSGYWWRGEGAVETTSFVLQAMVEIDPAHALRDDVARWLAHNRRGHRWDSTRSTAHAIYALCDHIAGTDAARPDYTLIARANGQELVRVRVTPESLLEAGGSYELPVSILRDGRNTVQLELEGTGTAWVTLEADLFTRAESIEAQGHVLEIEREVIRLEPLRTLGQGVVSFERPLADGDAVYSGDRIRVRLKLRARHDVDYVVVEDPRPAGAEPVEQLSGSFWAEGIGGRREVRDDRTAFFVSQVREGEFTIEYELRAESPGTFRMAPARALAMYLPDVAGHSATNAMTILAESETLDQ